jgi:hypothetical protein
MGVDDQRQAPPALTTGKRSDSHCSGFSVGLWVDLDGCGKPHPPQGFDIRTAQPVANRSTYCAIPAHNMKLIQAHFNSCIVSDTIADLLVYLKTFYNRWPSTARMMNSARPLSLSTASELSRGFCSFDTQNSFLSYMSQSNHGNDVRIFVFLFLFEFYFPQIKVKRSSYSSYLSVRFECC